MCKSLFGLTIAAGIATLLLFNVGTANADPYKWCASYDGLGATNCGFETQKQCLATISGVGGSCDLNQFFPGPVKGPAKRLRNRF